MNSRRNLWTAKLLGKQCPKGPVFAGRTDFTGFILGIDPSLRGSGFGIIEVGKNHQIKLIDSLTLKLSANKSFVILYFVKILSILSFSSTTYTLYVTYFSSVS